MTKLRLAMSKEQEETAACVLGTTGPSDLLPQPTRSRFTKSEKWFIVGFVGFVALFRQSFIMLDFETLSN